MSKKYSLQSNGNFVIKNYGKLKPFSNFLPGVSGQWGIPLWVFYVNRGQGVASFGIKDKNHSISEFFPANKAYSFVSSLGFRTFIKLNQDKCYEPFKDSFGIRREDQMTISSESFEIKDTNLISGLETTVKYFTLPNSSVGGLVRVVTIRNVSKKKIDLQVIDGLAQIVPFGSLNSLLKDMSRTLEAWMRVYVHDNLAMFRLIVDPRDMSQIKSIKGANFNYSFYEDRGKKISPYLIVDPEAIFSQDSSYSVPVNFLDKSFKLPLSQITCGKTPCAFSYFKWSLAPNQAKTFYSVFGAAFDSEAIRELTKSLNADSLRQKEEENKQVIRAIKDNALCVSGREEFDHYLGSTYLDNVLRGGLPYRAKEKTNSKNSGNSGDIYYIFSRKHGDLERDYNNFELLPSYFSEGEANYRDINQNRRMDLFFEPALAGKNIEYFFNFLKIDGYNPLVVKGEKLLLNRQKAKSLLKEFGIKSHRAQTLCLRGFYLGEFFSLLDEENINVKRKSVLIKKILGSSQTQAQASHGEGYWIDHWRYNLDLIDSYLYFYPEKLGELFLDEKFLFWDDEYSVKDRYLRYHLRGGVVYQGESIEVSKEKRTVISKRSDYKNFLRTKKGKIYETNLVCKLLTLILNKSATLDPAGVGIEMEADKPGWCDSLNGLPALFGSSLPETLELKRAAVILLNAIKQLSCSSFKEVAVPSEVFTFFKQLNNLLITFLGLKSKTRNYYWWNKANSFKEYFRETTKNYLKGDENKISSNAVVNFLENLITKLNLGIARAKDKKSGLPITYFTYEVKKYRLINKHVVPLEFSQKALPLFLEGVVHTLRVEKNKSIYQKVRRSKLFDKKLKMYKLNASLSGEPLEIGRSRIFTPGWLENESIWLHMEYKYLLELLRNGLVNEFFTSFYDCCVCFFDPQIYARNTLENSSFIVSSAFPDKNIWGAGFVARLSGATAELLNIWIILCLGIKPFSVDKSDKLCLNLSPILKQDFFTTASKVINFKGKKIKLAKNTFSFKLFSEILVCYHNPKRKDTFSKNCSIEKIIITQGISKVTLYSATIKSPLSLDVRNSKVDQIDVYFK